MGNPASANLVGRDRTQVQFKRLRVVYAKQDSIRKMELLDVNYATQESFRGSIEISFSFQMQRRGLTPLKNVLKEGHKWLP